MRTIILHGRLAKLCGRRHRFEVSSPAEAVRALCANFPAFRRHVHEAARQGLRFNVWNGAETISAKELGMNGSAVIRISPEVCGSKRGGVLQSIIGAVLIVVGIVAWEVGGEYLVEVGASLLLGGIVQMLTPTPKSDGPSDKPASNFFDGPVNVTAQGNPVPILYGHMIVGSAVISAGIEVDDIPVGASVDGSPPVIDFGP